MAFSSSPVVYPPDSSPLPASIPTLKKRKLFQTFPGGRVAAGVGNVTKKPRIVGGFLEDDENENEGHDAQRVGRLQTGLDGELVTEQPSTVAGVEHITPHEPSTSSQPSTSLDKSTRNTTPDLEFGHDTTENPALRSLWRKLPSKSIHVETSSGQMLRITPRTKSEPITYESIIASRLTATEGRARKSYCGVDIHHLIDEASLQRELDEAETQRLKEHENVEIPSVEKESVLSTKSDQAACQMWTEKYRAKKFTDLVGDERTHRTVLRWLKSWDSIVFPGSAKNPKMKQTRKFDDKKDSSEEQHRKILLLTGPPGLGKTTLAHVCAKQAGYDVLEINASDDRSRDVVKGRIKDALGTETVRGIKEDGKARKAGRPVCVVVDEVDGVVTGSSGSGGEGGFTKALIDLIQLDQRNSASQGKETSNPNTKKKGDKFRMKRPLILICNDLYAPSLRLLRQSSVAEIVQVRRVPLDKVIARLKRVFEKESINCDNDAVRRLCENAWGMGSSKQSTTGGRAIGEGDIRGVLVQSEWVAHKLRASQKGSVMPRLTRNWVEDHIRESQGNSNQKGLGRGGVREIVERVFLEGAGLPNLPMALSKEDARVVSESKSTSLGVADLRKRAAIDSLRNMIDTCGDHDRVMADCFATYPNQIYQDDVKLSKPNAGYEWLYFHDRLSSRIFSGQEWELNKYLGTGACGFHHLFAAVDKGTKTWSEDKVEVPETDAHPFSGPKADFAAYEAEKQHRTTLSEMQASFSASLLRSYSSTDVVAYELLPLVSRMLAPDVKPVLVGGSGNQASVASVRKDTEKQCIKTAVRVMQGLNISFEKIRIEIEGSVNAAHSHGGFAYRMEPPLDAMVQLHMPLGTPATAPVRYAVRQVLDQENRKETLLRASQARQSRSSLHADLSTTTDAQQEDKENANPDTTPGISIQGKREPIKRDFFGRIITNQESRPKSAVAGSKDGKSLMKICEAGSKGERRVWVSFHEGFSNAVRKPVSLRELMESFER